jgi:thiol-disulfide isomerase/thioredoxin
LAKAYSGGDAATLAYLDQVADTFPPVPHLTLREALDIQRDLGLLGPKREQADAATAPVRESRDGDSQVGPTELADLVKSALAAARETPAPSAPSSSPAAPAPLPPPDFTKADEAWAYVERLRSSPGPTDSPEDARRVMRSRLEELRRVGERFAAAFPTDPRRHAARLFAIDAGYHFGANHPDRDQLEEIVAAPDADDFAKGEAAFFLVMLATKQVQVSAPHTLPPLHQMLSFYLEKHPEHARTPYVANLQLQLLEAVETPGNENLLKKLSSHPAPYISDRARGILEHRAQTAELKKTPITLTFTAADGRQVDLAKMRGKVVLLDFWASWCAPCMAEAPHVVETFKRLESRGFAIVGVSLDEDRTAMEAAVKRTGMNWPHHFDGKGWQGELPQRFGIRSIPSTWLFDKNGKLREIGLRGKELEVRVEKLLEE